MSRTAIQALDACTPMSVRCITYYLFTCHGAYVALFAKTFSNGIVFFSVLYKNTIYSSQFVSSALSKKKYSHDFYFQGNTTMKLLSAIATLAVFTVAQAYQEGPNFGMPKSCSSGTPIFQAHYGSPSIYPMPFCPQAESDYIYILYGTLSEPLVQGTKLVISARVGGKLVYSDTQDYCSLLNVQPQGCTVPANQLVNLYTRVPKKNMPIEVSDTSLIIFFLSCVFPNGSTLVAPI